MWHESLFVSDCAEDFLCVSIADKPDIEASTYCLEPRVAVEMNAIRELPFFRSVNKLVLLPGELSEPCTPYLRDCPATELKIDYYSDVIDDAIPLIFLRCSSCDMFFHARYMGSAT